LVGSFQENSNAIHEIPEVTVLVSLEMGSLFLLLLAGNHLFRLANTRIANGLRALKKTFSANRVKKGDNLGERKRFIK